MSLLIVFTDIKMAGVKIRHWINQVEAVLDSRAEISTLSRGDTKTVLTPGVSMNLKCLHCVHLKASEFQTIVHQEYPKSRYCLKVSDPMKNF